MVLLCFDQISLYPFSLRGPGRLHRFFSSAILSQAIELGCTLVSPPGIYPCLFIVVSYKPVGILPKHFHLAGSVLPDPMRHWC